MLARMKLTKMKKQAASESQEPTGGGEVPREEGEVGGEVEKKKKEEEVATVVENGGIPGPTMVVQSRTIRFHIYSNIKVLSTKIECALLVFPYICAADTPTNLFHDKIPKNRFFHDKIPQNLLMRKTPQN